MIEAWRGRDLAKTYSREDFEPLSQAEAAVFDARFEGSIKVSDERPLEANNFNRMRASFLRALLLGEIEGINLSKATIVLSGVFIEGALELQFCEIVRPFFAYSCVFAGDLDLNCARIPYLRFEKSQFLALKAQGIEVSGSLCIENCEAHDQVNFMSAKIHSQLSCENSKFLGVPESLNLQSVQIEGGVFLTHSHFEGILTLEGAQLSSIVDNAKSWPKEGKLRLQGMTFKDFQGDAPQSARRRLEWLSRSPFHPQPYKEVARVLREAGRERDARIVLYEMEYLFACEEKSRLKQRIKYVQVKEGEGKRYIDERFQGRPRILNALDMKWQYWGWRIVDFSFHSLIGYGYKLHRALFWYLGLVGILALVALGAYRNGQVAPNAAPVLVSQNYIEIDDPYAWANSPFAADWEDFNAVVWAADVITPLIDFGQESAWAPSTRGWWGFHLWWLRWPAQIMGWIIATFVVTSVTGLIQRRHS